MMMHDPFRNYDRWLESGNPADNDPCEDCDAETCNDCGLCLDHCECNVRAYRADVDYQAWKEGERIHFGW